MENSQKKEILNKLVEYFPQLKCDIDETITDFSEIYLHLIFGDVFNPYLIGLLEEPEANKELILKSGELLEYMMMFDEPIQEVVVVTVLERLSDDKKILFAFSKFAGDNTRQYISNLL